MAWNPTNKEIQKLLAAPAETRYEYFIKRSADTEQVWSLRNGSGWVLGSDGTGTQMIPVWPHPCYATACLSGEWSDCQPSSIELTVWLERWIPGIIADKRGIAIFATPMLQAVEVQPERLRDDLLRELEKY